MTDTIDDAERKRLHDALDHAIDLRNRAQDQEDISRELATFLINEIALPVGKEAFHARFKDCFDTSYQEDDKAPPDIAAPGWLREALGRTENTRAIWSGLASWFFAVDKLLPDGVAAQIVVALFQAREGELSWFFSVPQSDKRPFTKNLFATIVCQEIAFLQTLKGWSAGNAFYEVTGNLPRRHSKIGAKQEGELELSAHGEVTYAMYEHYRRLVTPEDIAIAKRAGKLLKSGKEPSGAEARYVAFRDQRISEHGRSIPPDMWGYMKTGSEIDSESR